MPLAQKTLQEETDETKRRAFECAVVGLDTQSGLARCWSRVEKIPRLREEAGRVTRVIPALNFVASSSPAAFRSHSFHLLRYLDLTFTHSYLSCGISTRSSDEHS